MKDIRITEIRVDIVDKGDDGYSPKLGVDYFTQEDKEKLVEEVIDGLDDYTPPEIEALEPMTEEELRNLL